MLRVACSKVVPCAFRAAASPRIVSPRINNAFANPGRRFSSSATSGCWINQNIVKALDSEIDIIQLIKQRPAPPPLFTLKTESTTPYAGHVLLTRELFGEEIDVRVLDTTVDSAVKGHCSDDDDVDRGSTTTDSDTDSDSDTTDNSSDDDEEAEKIVRSPVKTVPLKIEITKQNGKSLKFAAFASAHEIVIERLTTKDGNRVICSQLYIKPDSELQMALREFLRVRGIEESMAGFLYEHEIWKSKIPQGRGMIERSVEESSGRNDPEQLYKLWKLKEVIGAW